ncbi:hypothetical protein [Rhizobium sp. BK251]|uniref:hypothetical protein n=1 Tax=Rhizobium sp. BK251 TaxID=2512125 RepID=UPI00104C96E1|nr:hypothetical protein [Rhizobium sp. BK251]
MEFNIVCPHVQYMRTDGLIYGAIGHPFLATKIFFVAEFPIKARIVFLTFATSQNKEFCDCRNVRYWRKAVNPASLPVGGI